LNLEKTGFVGINLLRVITLNTRKSITQHCHHMHVNCDAGMAGLIGAQAVHYNEIKFRRRTIMIATLKSVVSLFTLVGKIRSTALKKTVMSYVQQNACRALNQG
jgi:hypothetical protein